MSLDKLHQSSTRFFRMISRTNAVASSRMLSMGSSIRQYRTTFPSGLTRNFQKFHFGIFCTESETHDRTLINNTSYNLDLATNADDALQVLMSRALMNLCLILIISGGMQLSTFTQALHLSTNLRYPCFEKYSFMELYPSIPQHL